MDFDDRVLAAAACAYGVFVKIPLAGFAFPKPRALSLSVNAYNFLPTKTLTFAA
jgi:hypothetical protein